jgi:NAD(P)-dependent dehydrogenase (short-subunit alcohol dehydrogenase family)
LTWALARRLKDTGVTANAMTPGLITDTRLYRNAPQELVERLTVYAGGRTIEEGADTLVWLASSPDVEGVTNKFFENREEVKCEFRNRKDEEKLWKICTDLTSSASAS